MGTENETAACGGAGEAMACISRSVLYKPQSRRMFYMYRKVSIGRISPMG